MNPRVVAVTAHDDYTLTLVFDSGESRRFDARPYLDQGFFRDLRSGRAFAAARVVMGTVEWPGGQDFCPDTLYLESVPAETPAVPD